MNILYFGPYKDIFEHGIPSRSVIGSLAKKCQSGLSIRNILLTPHTGGVSSLLPPNISSDHSTSPDIIIQHVPVDHLSYPRKNSGTINAAIPMDLDISRPNDRLQYFDLILVDEIDKYNILCEKFSSDKVKLFRYEYDIVSKGTYDLKLYANTKKFYFVNDYINNQHTIQKIIIAFNLAFRSNQDVGLFLCFNDQNQYNKEIRTFIDDTKTKLRISNITHREIILFNSFDPPSINAIHNTGNVYLDLYDHARSNYHRQIAEYHNNQILSTSDLENIRVPAIEDSLYFPGQIKRSITTQSLVEKLVEMNDQIKPSQYNYETTPNINDILYVN